MKLSKTAIVGLQYEGNERLHNKATRHQELTNAECQSLSSQGEKKNETCGFIDQQLTLKLARVGVKDRVQRMLLPRFSLDNHQQYLPRSPLALSSFCHVHSLCRRPVIASSCSCLIQPTISAISEKTTLSRRLLCLHSTRLISPWSRSFKEPSVTTKLHVTAFQQLPAKKKKWFQTCQSKGAVFECALA